MKSDEKTRLCRVSKRKTDILDFDGFNEVGVNVPSCHDYHGCRSVRSQPTHKYVLVGGTNSLAGKVDYWKNSMRITC